MYTKIYKCVRTHVHVRIYILKKGMSCMDIGVLKTLHIYVYVHNTYKCVLLLHTVIIVFDYNIYTCEWFSIGSY